MSILLKQELTIMGDKVVIEPQLLDFNESNLPSYLQKEAGYYAYYGAMLANAEAEEQIADCKAEEKYDTLFWTFKQEGQGSDKFCECRARSQKDVVEARERQINAKRNVTMLKMFLRAFDKNHDNAQSTGHNLRKEMEKLGQGGERLSDELSYHDRLDDVFRNKSRD